MSDEQLSEDELMLVKQNAYLAQFKERGVEFMLIATMIYQRAWETALATKRESIAQANRERFELSEKQAIDFTDPKTHSRNIVKKAVMNGVQNATGSHSTMWPSDGELTHWVMQELDKIHPWERFLRGRRLCIQWMKQDGKSDAYIAETLSMDELQVRMIREACVDDD